MKRFVAILLTAMLFVSAMAFAETNVVTIYEDSKGNKVTLTMQDDYVLTPDDDAEDGLYQVVVSREGVAPVYVNVAPISEEEAVSLNQYSDEDLQAIVDYFVEMLGENASVTVEVTPSGNKYILAIESDETGEIEERWTVFEGFEFSRIMFHDDFSHLTAEDEAFMDEVQQGMWVTAAEEDSLKITE